MTEVTVRRTGSGWTTGSRLLIGIGVLAACVLGTGVASSAASAAPRADFVAGTLRAAAASPVTADFRRTGTPQAARPRDSLPSCSFNNVLQATVIPVTPGASIAISCTGWLPNEQVTAFAISPLALATGSQDDVDLGATVNFQTDGAGTLHGTFTVPDPFVAADPAAVCPPTADQVASGLLRCGILMSDGVSQAGGYQGIAVVAFDYAGAPPPPPPAAVGIAATPDGGGYWIADADGHVSDHGDALPFGDASGLSLTAPIAHIVATPNGGGYWLVAGDGGTFAYGDAGFYGSMGGAPLNQPVVDLAPTKDGKGYWLVASDGGIFAFGDAGFHGSMGGQRLNRPVVGIAADDASGGYWEVATDGGIFAFGAPFFGSTGALALNQPINGMTATTSDGGYLFVASDGGVFAFGNAGFHGSAGALALAAPIVGMALDPATGGYWLLGSDGGVFAFDCPFYGAA
jgi:hypothetical protein